MVSLRGVVGLVSLASPSITDLRVDGSVAGGGGQEETRAVSVGEEGPANVPKRCQGFSGASIVSSIRSHAKGRK